MRYVVLLRGVNVSGKNKLPMAEFRKGLENIGFIEVKSYIQSGNIALDSELKSSEVEALIMDLLKKEFEIDVPVHVIPQQELSSLFEESPFVKEASMDNRFVHFTLLKTAPTEQDIEVFDRLDIEGEHKHSTKYCVNLFLPNGYGRAKLNNGFIERKLAVSATTRNYKTFTKLMEL